MNLNNLNKSQIKEMWLRVDDIRESKLINLTVYERYNGRYAYLWSVLWKLNTLLHSFGNDYTLCAYCCNNLDHNLNDHKLAVERQKVTKYPYIRLDSIRTKHDL